MVTLVFVAVILAAVALDVWFIRPWEIAHRSTRARGADSPIEFIVPRTLFFHRGHTWARLDGDGRVAVGIDDLARTIVGDLSMVELPAIGARLTAGREAFGVRQGERRLSFVSPVSGIVTEVNASLGRDPVRLRWRPYKEGWVYRVAPGERLSVELPALLIGRDAERWMSAELDQLGRAFDRGALAPPVEGALLRAGADAWGFFQNDVLKVSAPDKEPVS